MWMGATILQCTQLVLLRFHLVANYLQIMAHEVMKLFSKNLDLQCWTIRQTRSGSIFASLSCPYSHSRKDNVMQCAMKFSSIQVEVYLSVPVHHPRYERKKTYLGGLGMQFSCLTNMRLHEVPWEVRPSSYEYALVELSLYVWLPSGEMAHSHAAMRRIDRIGFHMIVFWGREAGWANTWSWWLSFSTGFELLAVLSPFRCRDRVTRCLGGFHESGTGGRVRGGRLIISVYGCRPACFRGCCISARSTDGRARIVRGLKYRTRSIEEKAWFLLMYFVSFLHDVMKAGYHDIIESYKKD